MSFIGKTLGKIVGHQSKSQSQSTASSSNSPQSSQLYNQNSSSSNVINQQSNNSNPPSTTNLRQQQLSNDSQLTLTHLRKVFYEYMHPKNHDMSQSERDDKLYNILPLFIKAFGHSSLIDINDKFGDVEEFCIACTKLLVNEITKRVHDDLVLVKFFEIKTSEDATDGSGLLNTVNLLASGPPFLIELMTKFSLPSRLVMCVYLFICLPEPKDSILDLCEFNAKERRILFQKCFHQLLTKLCQNSCTCDELVEADSLKLLFKIISSTCEQHNIPWRQTAADALLTITKNLNLKAMHYLSNSQSIQMCLQCMDHGEICSSNLIERSQLLITVLTFLRETSFISQVLLEDFRISSGYKIITDISMRLEKENKDECRAELRNLFYCLEEFCSAGFNELKLNNSNISMFKIEGFQVPQPTGKGRTVRNPLAFQTIITIFNKAQTLELCSLVLNTIRNIYNKDHCNYFLLESQNVLLYSMDETSIKIHIRNNDIQLKFIELLDFIVFDLKFVPCKELVSIGLSIQNYNCTKWSINSANFLFKLIKTNQVYKDAFRELGLLEIIVSCLHKFAVLLKEKQVDKEIHIESHQKELGFLIMDIICSLISHNNSNAKIFRELGGARLAHNMVPYKLCRSQALNIVSTLLLTTAGEDDMSTLLGLMHTAKMEDLELKNSVLRSLLHILRESHRTRTVFRKAGGFVYLVSVLISMEGCLSIEPKSPWNNVNKNEIFKTIKTILNALAVSMRYEPANAKFFETEVRWKSLCSALKLLGCFDTTKTQFEPRTNNDFVKRGFDVFETYFCNLEEDSIQPLPPSTSLSNKANNQNSNNSNLNNSNNQNSMDDDRLIYFCHIMRYLYDTAIDTFDKHDLYVDFSDGFEDRPFNRHANKYMMNQPGSQDSYLKTTNTSLNSNSIKKSNSFINNLTNPIDEPLIVHPGAISSILHLLTSVSCDKNEHMASRLQYQMINLIKNLLRFERNQQLMSNANFIDDIIFTCKHVLNDETHFLNSSIQHIFERLATQSIKPKSLREYLRSGTVFDPTSTNPDKNILIPLNRVKCIISMTTPRDSRQHIGTSFVEFNMFVEGFGCLFLPSIAPQLTNAPSIVAMGMVSVGNDLSVNGGVGSGERIFPPQSGISFSTWICVDKFGKSSSLSDNNKIHPIRILTLLKHSKIKDTLSSCLSIYLSPKYRSLFISTEESLLQHQKMNDSNEDEDVKLSDNLVKFNCSELFQEGHWLHLTFVFSRAVLKNSSVSLYVNSNLIGTQKLNYINSHLNSNISPSAMAVHAVIGTLPQFRVQSPVIWRQASCYLFEDIIQPNVIQSLYKLGPNYLGSFQSPNFDNNSFENSTVNLLTSASSLISDEKIVFGLHSQNIFEMTLAKFRKIYNKNDSKAIGKLLNLPSNECVTPLRIISNTAAQLNGPARSVGGVIIGYLGVRTFQPMPVSKSIEHIGGVQFLLGLIAMANDIEFMYASVKALVCICKSNVEVAREMDRLNGYQLLGMLYKRKKSLINSHILNLTFSLVISDDTGKEQAIISNVKAFEYLLCDLEIWYDTPSEIQRSLHERFNDLLNDQITNARLFHRLNMLKRFLFMIKEANSNTLNENTLKYIISTIKILIVETTQNEDLIKFGQYLASLLPDLNTNEKYANLECESSSSSSSENINSPPNSASTFTLTSLNNTDNSLIYTIKLRNKLLSIIDDIMSKPGCTKSITFQEEFQRLLGYDWFLLFMQPNVHKTTLIKSCKMLFTLLLNTQNLYKFKDSSFCGGWLNNIFSQLKPNTVSTTTTTTTTTSTTNATPTTPTTSSAITTPTNPIKNTLMNSSVTSISSDSTTATTTTTQSIQTQSSVSVDINLDACLVPGFQLMQVYFAKNPDIVELYYLLFALLFDAQRIKELPQNADLNLNSICKYVFDKSFDSEHNLFCKINKDVSLDITIILLSMIRSLMNPSIKLDADSKDYAIILLQIFRFMYHNCDDFRSMASNSDFLSSLILTLYPYSDLTQQELNDPTPSEIKPFAEAICNQDLDGKSTYHSYLSIHPARKLVMDFLRDLLYDGLVNSSNNINNSIQSYANYYYGTKQGQQIIDQILLSLPDNSTNLKRNQEFITELFKTILDYLLSSDIFNEQPHLPQLNTNINFVLQNFFNLIDRLVDKLWDDMYRREPKEVFELIVKFMNNLKKKPYNFSNEQLINSMNRCLLYQLSRPCESLNEQVGMLDVLHKMSQLKTLIFSPTNSQSDFFGCVAHCLLMITSTDEMSHMDLISPNTAEDITKKFQSKTLWYANPNFNEKLQQPNNLSFDSITTVNNNENNNDKAAKYLLVSAAQRVWLELYLNKKSNLEECLKVSLNSIGKNPTLDELRPILTEPARKVFTSFIDGEKKLPERIQSQLQAKFQRVTDGITTITGGFSRVVSLKKQKKEMARLTPKELNDSINSILANLMSMREYNDSEYRKYFRSNEQRHNYLYTEWLSIEKDLLRERALWGMDVEDKLNKWKLDLTEGPNRQRKRLLPNTTEFYKHYQYKPTIDFLKPNKKYKIPSSFDSKEYYNSFKVQSLLHHQQNLLDKIATDREHQQMILQHQLEQQQQLDDYDPPSEIIYENNNQTNIDDLTTPSNVNNNDEVSSPTIISNNPTYVAQSSSSTSYNQNITRLLEEGEKINHIYRCARVQGLDTTEGVFLFGKEHFYVLDGFTLISTKDIVDIDCLKPSAYEPLIPKSGGGGGTNKNKLTEKQCSKFAYEDIREVHNRRYLLQEIAMEIFSNDGRNYLLVFPRKCRNKIYERLIALTPDLNDSAQQSIAGQRRSTNIEQNTSILNALIGEKSVVQRWERGEISNFQYLMFLNTLAGRSYNDLMQYPVFPWILADYDSDELDLNNSSTFRDLSKPMGAQTQERLKQFEKRFIEWEDPTGETPPYFYGTHYSSAMIVASYLLRLEPFTQIFLRLQGGHFDLADRLFHSVKDNWLSASRNNMADVKELIPEFFYLPEFLSNSNKFDLGRKQSGVVLNDVVLPSWAKNDPREFIRVHRMALESDYVSAHLNEWIDLIFGFKQQGQPAIDSFNVFHHLFYEGAVNIDEIDDPLKRSAIIGFINNFGQIPKQLFKKPHPTKKLNTQFLYGIAGNLVNTTLGNTAVNLVTTQSDNNHHQLTSNPSSSSLSLSYQTTSQQLVFIHYLKSLKPSLQPVKELKSQVGQIVATDKGILVVEQNKFLMPPKYDRYVAWGYSDESIKIGYTDYEKSFVTFENIQDGAIFCCCSPDSKIIITAGTNTVVNVWELSKLKQRRIQLKTRLFGHQDTVTCMAVSNGYHMLVTGSRDQSCIIWDINKWTFVRQLPNHYGAVSCVCINELTGDIVTASSTFVYLWNINGELLASVNAIPTSRTHLILCVYVSQVNEWDDKNVILTGGTDGIVRMWSLGYNQVPENQVDENRQDFDTISQKTVISAEELDSNNKSSSVTPSSCIENTPDNVDNQSKSSKKEADFFPESFNPENLEKKDDKEDNNVLFTNNEHESDGETTCLIQENNNNNEIKTNTESIKSETDDEFIMVDRNQFTSNSNEFILKPGYVWRKELIFRNKLTMHTSYDRTDNSEPASVTAISISKDNRIIYVGDSRGRVYSWICNENPGKSRADHWMRDDLVEKCKVCNVKFSFSERKHHCRNCGGIFCNNCSKFEIDIPRLHIYKPVRVCQSCHNQIKANAEQDALNQTAVSTPSSTS